MKPTTKKAVQDLLRRKLRTALTILGIAIGVMGLSAVMLASDQLGRSLTFSLDTSTQPDIQFFTTPTAPTITTLLQQQPNVQQVAAQTFVPTRWAIPSGHQPLTILGLPDLQHPVFHPFELVAGHLPNGPDQVLMEANDRTVTPFQVGGQITVSTPGGEQSLTVVGLSRTRGLPAPSLTGSAVAYMRQQDLQSLFHLSGSNIFLIRLDHYDQRQATARQLAQVLRAHGISILSATIGHEANEGQQLLDGLFAIMQVLSIIALLLSSCLLLSTITTLLSEQIPIMGTMKALGARRRQIMRSYLLSVLLYGLAGTLIGLGLGIALGSLLVNYLADLMTLDIGPLALNPSLFLISVALGLGVPLLAALLPIWLGTRVSVRQALSGYGLVDSQAGQLWSRFVGRTLAFLPQRVHLGIRTLFRKRLRTALTLLALAITGSAFLCVQITSTSLGNVLSQIFSSYQADIFVSLDTPQPFSRLQPELLNVGGVATVEPLNQVSVRTAWGSSVLTGLLPDTQLYRKQLLAGRWFSSADENVVVISNVCAQKTGLHVGDSITVSTDLNSARWQIIGVVQDYNDFAEVGTLLVPLRQAAQFMSLPSGETSALMIRASSRDQSAIDALARRLDGLLSQSNLQVTIQTAQQEIQRNQNQFLILYALLYCAVAIIALVGVLSLFNILTMSILERRREIGILRALGASGGKVALAFWTEGLTLATVAWLLALVMGLPAGYGFIQLLGKLLLPVPFTLNPLSLLGMLLLILLLASLASLGPAWGAARLNAAQALRYE
ncbi:hypothetical protein KTAU_24220 [Thermogemmatispora aurantia]|uniref:ABC transporter permease n=1 Tax=Thermogemmatispora aurantia TaxID=2045279 RepID=A0A5J4K8F7_9CHLR|nr:FtsX-like permease family protein [Thermogemmatispora aurantia]GER83785.1 hypothetical protein KTAU_24220 [Thermogemmatispora aurantia]